MQQIIQKINDSLNHMEDTGKVDLSILYNLKELGELLEKIKTKWLEYPDTRGFYFHHAARNVELILEKMKDRFQSRTDPKIAADSLILLPKIARVLEITQTDMVSDSSIDNVLEKIRHLRDTAASTNLIESLDTDRNMIDKDSLRHNFTRLMSSLEINSDKYT